MTNFDQAVYTANAIWREHPELSKAAPILHDNEWHVRLVARAQSRVDFLVEKYRDSKVPILIDLLQEGTMPNPSLLAMEEENDMNQAIAEENKPFKKFIRQVEEEAKATGTEDELAAYNEHFKKAADAQATATGALETVQNTFEELKGLNDEASDTIYAQHDVIEDLKAKVAKLEKANDALMVGAAEFGAHFLELREVAQRHREFNADSVQEIRDMRAIARAAARARAAYAALENAEVLTNEEEDHLPDSLIQEVADADGDLERLLIDAKFLNEDGSQNKER